MATIWLSVIMPTYNGERFLPRALESIARQRDDAVEVIAVDDGSTDGSRDVLRDFARRLRLTIVPREHGGNWVANTNLGMSRARGKYLCWLHQDDVWSVDRLSLLRRLVVRWPRAALLFHRCWYVREDGRRIGLWNCPFGTAPRSLSSSEVLERLIVQCFLASCGTLFRADAAAAAGPLDECLWYSADWEFWLRLAAIGPAVYCPRPLASFRVHGGSQTLARLDRHEELRAQHDSVLARHLGGIELRGVECQSIGRVARFSADMNVALAALAAGSTIDARRLAAGFLRLGPAGWRRYCRDSRVVERCLSRWRAGVFERRRGEV